MFPFCFGVKKCSKTTTAPVAAAAIPIEDSTTLEPKESRATSFVINSAYFQSLNTEHIFLNVSDSAGQMRFFPLFVSTALSLIWM